MDCSDEVSKGKSPEFSSVVRIDDVVAGLSVLGRADGNSVLTVSFSLDVSATGVVTVIVDASVECSSDLSSYVEVGTIFVSAVDCTSVLSVSVLSVVATRVTFSIEADVVSLPSSTLEVKVMVVSATPLKETAVVFRVDDSPVSASVVPSGGGRVVVRSSSGLVEDSKEAEVGMYSVLDDWSVKCPEPSSVGRRENDVTGLCVLGATDRNSELVVSSGDTGAADVGRDTSVNISLV